MINYYTEPHPAQIPEDLNVLLKGVETTTIGHNEHVGFLCSNIKPLFPAKISGTAVTVAAPGRDGTIIYRVIDTLVEGDVLVISRIDGSDIACVGGGVAKAAKAHGAAGIIIDGPCTDVEEIQEVGLPVWCRGSSSKTTNRKFAIGGSINVPVACGGAAVLPGYAVLADNEGVYVAEHKFMRKMALHALERQQRSHAVHAKLAQGISIFDIASKDHK